MAIDYTKLMPEPPEDLVEAALKQGAFANTDKVIFGAEYVYMPLTGRKERMAKCVCTACGDEWYEMWAADEMGCGRHGRSYGIETEHETVYSGNSWICPQCGNVVNLVHKSEINPTSRYNKNVWITVFGRIGSSFTVTDYCIIQRFFKDGRKEYEVRKYSAYIFESDRKCVQLQGFRKNFNTIVFYEDWWQKKKCDGIISDTTSFIYLYDEDFLKGTTMENSRLDKYLDCLIDGNHQIFPVKYLRLYQQRHKIETIMDLGLEYMVRDEIKRVSQSYYGDNVNTCFKGAKWKEKSPYKILGYDRREMKLIKEAQLDWHFLSNFLSLKEEGLPMTVETVNLVRRFDFYSISKIKAMGLPVMKTLKYLEKQDARGLYFEDYRNMARKLGLDLDNPVICYPKNLRGKHDELVQKIKWNESQALIEKFKKLAESLESESYSDGNMCIRIAKSEKELIQEGKILKHCVGGYGKNHCDGRSIFFVRKASEPDMPWYTLQVELMTGRQIQLHGYENDRVVPVPEEVKRFVNNWLLNVFRRFDTEHMVFIDKQNAAATHKTDFAVDCKE